MDRAGSTAAGVAAILRANPDGISRAGLMAWARLRIAADLTDAELDAALHDLGAAVSVEAGFVRLVGPPSGPERGSVPPAMSTASLVDRVPVPQRVGDGSAGTDRRSPAAGQPGDASGWAAAEGLAGPEGGEGRPTEAFSTASLVDAVPPLAGWDRGSRPSRGIRALLTFGSLVVVLAVAFFARSGSDGSSAGSTAVPSDARGSIAVPDELAIGSCFVVPAASTFSEVEIRPCDAPHDGEVIEIWDETVQPGASYPSDAEWRSAVESRCEAGFETYTGRSFSSQSALTYGWFVPDEDAWVHGSRTVQCYLSPADGGSLSRSYRASS